MNEQPDRVRPEGAEPSTTTPLTRETVSAPTKERSDARETTRLWETMIVAQFEADNPEDAAAIAQRLAERVLEHPCVWGLDAQFDRDQTTETVDG